jgi:tape measure domain-containing protein
MATSVGSIEYIARIDTAKLKADAAVASKTVKGVGDSSEASAAQGSAAFAKFGKVGLTAAIAGATALVAVFASKLPAAISRIDTLNNAPKILQNLGYSADESTKAIDKMDKGLRGLPTTLDGGVNAMMRFVTTTNKGIDYATDLTLAFNNMLLAGGRGPQEAARGMQQFTQILARGKVEMEEWNTLNEVMPAQMKQLATSMLGPTATTMDLYNAIKEGNISIEQMTDKVVELNETGGANFASWEKQAKDATFGIATAFDLMDTAITRGTTAIVKGIGEENITGFADKVGKAFEDMGKFIADAINYAKPYIEDLFASVKPVFDYLTNNETLILMLKAAFIALGIAIGLVVLGAIAIFTLFMVVGKATFEALVWAVETLITGFFWLRDKLAEAITEINVFFKNMLDKVSEVFNRLLDGARNTWDSIWGAITGVANRIISFFSGAWQWLVDAGKSIIGGLVDGIKNMGGAVWDAISGAAAKIGEFFSGAASWLFDAGKNIIGGLIDGIKSMIGKVQDTLGSITDKIPDWKGPAQRDKILLVRNAELIMGGFIKGLEGQFGAVQSTLGGLTADVPAMANSGLEWLDNEPTAANNNSTVVNLNMSGIMSRSAADERDIARNLIKRLNQELTAKGQPAIGGIV